MTFCKEIIKHVFPQNVSQLREILFDKLDSLDILYSDDQKILKNLAETDFKSICLQKDKFRDTDTKTWIVKHFPISVSISPNLIQQPIFYAIPITELWLSQFLMLLFGYQHRAKRKGN